MRHGGRGDGQQQCQVAQRDAVQKVQRQADHQGRYQAKHRRGQCLGQNDLPCGYRQHHHRLDRAVDAFQMVERAGQQQAHDAGIRVQQQRREPARLRRGQQGEQDHPDHGGRDADGQDLIADHPLHFTEKQFDKAAHTALTPVTRMKMSSMLVSPLWRVSISFSLRILINSSLPPMPAIGKLSL
ncbi:hypothetical protein SDC9_115093 [bioreactor metagenome]|uniref:Uncharacterized protein n=1 Tax=bioreactor metagenome TaxID=1076179 RepID=A0A645BSE7_9ZZZZ